MYAASSSSSLLGPCSEAEARAEEPALSLDRFVFCEVIEVGRFVRPAKLEVNFSVAGAEEATGNRGRGIRVSSIRVPNPCVRLDVRGSAFGLLGAEKHIGPAGSCGII